MSAISFRALFDQAAAMSSRDGGLARRSRGTYWLWVKAFAEFTGKLMGHESAETTLIYVGSDGAEGVSPLDVGMDATAPARALPGRCKALAGGLQG